MIEFKQTPNNLCIFRLSAIGDVTHILPVIHTLQNVWPQTELTWVIGKLEYQLVKNLPGVEFIIFDKSLGWKAYINLHKQLNGRRFDLLLMLQAALRASFASLLIPAQYKLGFDKQRAIDFQWLFSNQKISGPTRVHVLDGFFQFLQAIGIEQKLLVWDYPEEPQSAQFADHLLDNRPTVIINPCSSARKNNWRNWAIDSYARIADYLHSRDIQVVITGAPAEKELEFCQAIVTTCQSSPINLCGKTSLSQLLALIKRCKFIIAPDTGPAHMATMANTPVIGLFASSNPARTGPYKSQELVIDQYAAALQQFKHKSLEQASWGERVRDPEVMSIIQYESVQLRIDELLDQNEL